MPRVESPRINPRNFQRLLDEKKSIIPYYAPEWDISDEKDAGFALLKIFTHMHEEIIKRLNRVPDKNFTAFLDMLGVKLMPAQPAKVPVTFYLSEGMPGGVFVPARTQAAAGETEKHGTLVFETTKNFFAVSNAIEEIYFADPINDSIFCYSDDFRNKTEFNIFKGEDNKNLHKHVLYLGHDELFKLKMPAVIMLQFVLHSGSLDDLIWKYWGSDEKNPEDFSNVSPVASITDNSVTVTLTSNGEMKEKEINGRKSHWILCTPRNVLNAPFIKWIKILNVSPKADTSGEQTIKPDIGFYNNIPVDVTGKVYPFGKQPRLFDTFYIASKETFSKKKAIIDVKFTRSKSDVNADIVPTVVSLSWEYWNGTLWQSLVIGANDNTIEDFKLLITTSGIYEGHIKFNCPEDIKETEVNGEKNFWIRVRLVSGNYGKDKFVEDSTKKFWIINPEFHPPWVDSIDIGYSFASGTYADLQHCLAFNNLEYRDFTKESKEKENKENTRFKPFIPLPENKPTIYLGFKNAFRKGNISIFFSLEDKEYTTDARPKIEWTYWGRAANLLNDMTNLSKVNMASVEGLSVGNELLFEELLKVNPPEGSKEKDSKSMPFISGTAKVKLISEPDKKIALENELDHAYTKNASVFKRTSLEVTDSTEYLTRSGTLEFIGQSGHSKTHKFGRESFWLLGTVIKSPDVFDTLIKGIYPNTVWAEQIETIEDEILGSSDGDKKKKYNFTRFPVISPEIWIMEGKIISETEKEKPTGEDIKELKDETGKIKETWVKWKVVDDFLDSSPGSRHCVVDNSMGVVQFGDGEHGMIPPIGKDNIKANYKSGGGVKGNVMKNEISVLKTPVAGVDRVTNHLPAEGGADTELLEEVFERGPHLIKHRSRAVTIEDFERLAREASSYIARTRCITEGNKLKVIIIPKGEEDKPGPSMGLKKTVKDYLIGRSLNSIHKYNLEVSNPVYKEVKVTVEVIPVSIDRAVPLEMEILTRLKEYLHPLTGGNEKTGWEFGRGVHISDIYALLEGIDGVDHVENLKLNDDSYLFCWEDISDNETDRNRLLKFLKYNFNINWADNAGIDKQNKDIYISSKDTQAKIKITLEETQGIAILEISADRTYNLLLKIENDKHNIYSKDLYIETDEIVCSGDHRITMKLGG